MPQKKIIRFKVFLIDFPDVRAPSGYTKDFVNELVFGATRPDTSPPPDSVQFGCTVFQYFFAASDGWIRVAGDTQDWAKSQINNGDIPHWNSGSMSNPSNTNALVYFGESWPVIVAESLRLNNFTSVAVRNSLPSTIRNRVSSSWVQQQLRRKILSLPDGNLADRIVFLNTDRASGGVRRSIQGLKDALNFMSASNNRVRTIPGSQNLWSTLWDEGWSGLPDFLVTPIINPKHLGTVMANGQISGSAPNQNDLCLAPVNVIFHECGHLVTDFPDLYRKKFAPWGVFDIMDADIDGGTHYPPLFGSYLRNMAGWLTFRERSREKHSLRLQPLETHNDAIRLTNGAPGSNHFMVLENRDELHYGTSPDQPPTSNGRMLLAYRLDKHGRQRVSHGDGSVRKITSLIRCRPAYGEAWRPGMTIDKMPPPNEISSYPSTCRNALGELWWTVDKIDVNGFGDLDLDLNMRAVHLLTDYNRATWTSKKSGKASKPLDLDVFGGDVGHVMLVDSTMEVQGAQKGRALHLHPAWSAWANVRGTYDISAFTSDPVRLYAKLAMPDSAVGSDGVTVQFRRGGKAYNIALDTGDHKEVCLDFLTTGTNNFRITVYGGRSATRDWVYLLDGWLVPLAPTQYDFVANAANAIWRTGTGAISFGVMDQPTGEASVRSSMVLHTKVEHGTKVMFTHPNWANNGYIKGEYRNVPIPAGGAFLRGVVGWHHGRQVTDNGALIDIEVQEGNNRHTLIQDADINLYGNNEADPLKRNDNTILELPLPQLTWGKSVTFRIKVKTAGSAGQDWVSWPYLALTSA